MPFRATNLTLLFAAMICQMVGCEQTTAGTATPSGTPSFPDPAEPVPGVVTTLPDHIPPNALACFPSPTANGRMTVAAVSDPVAPRLTVSLPDGWSSAAGTGIGP